MAWFRAGGGGIPSSLKLDMNDVFNKKFGTVLQDYPPEDWPGTVNLMGPLPERAVSGSVVAFADGADDVPLKSASFGISASGGGGTPSSLVPIVGKSSVTVYQTGKNILPNTAQTATDGNVTFTVNSDGSVSLSGIASTEVNFYIYSGFAFPKTGTYKLTGCPSGGSTNTFRLFATNYGGDTGSGLTINVTNTSTTTSIRINIKSGVDTSGLVFKPQIEVGSIATAYEAYKSKTPITVALGQTVYGGTLAEDGTLTVTHALVPFSDCTWASVTSYQSNFNSTNGIVSLRFGKNAMASAGYAQKASTSLCNVFDNQSRSVWNNVDRMYEIGYTDGISFNVLYSDIGMSEWTSDATTIQNAFRASSLYSDGYITLELATPVVITGLDEISISTYLGDNNIWCDTGDASVTYRRDIDLALAQ